ncbi:MAG: DUF362 domain-containing protein [Oscillospiraceae bacterium]|nr:DUF362 domain-containing protein [Oscillospiraceae bacterium]
MKEKNRNGNVIKNLCWLIILALFLTGGAFSLSNCSGSPVSETETETETGENTERLDSGGEEETSTGGEETPTEPEEPEVIISTDILPYNKLNIDSNSIVGISQSSKANAADLTFDDIKALIIEAVELAGGLGDIVKDGQTVVLKPNLVSKFDFCLPGWRGRQHAVENNGVVTDWRVTRAVAQIVRELNPTGKIYVMEGSAADTLDVMEALNYTKSHMPEVDEFYALEKDSGEWQDKNSDGLVKVVYENALLHKEYYLNKKFYEADVVINIPTLKNHWDAVVTGNVKNIAIGATPGNIYGNGRNDPGRNNMVDHGTPNFHKWMADFYSCRPADFVITEGLQGIENGPTPSFDLSGVSRVEDAQKNMRVIMASKDGLAIDIVQTNIINWDIDSVQYLQYLIEAGNVGNGNSKNITVLGKKVDEIRSDFAGVIPGAGGRKLTKKTPPSLAIESAAFDGQNLKLKLDISDDTDKLDIYIDGIYAGSVNENMTDISFSAMAFDSGTRDIIIYSYDKYMNCAEANIKADKADGKITLGLYDYAAPFAETAPVTDGSGADSAWAKAEWRPIDQEWLGNIPSPDVFSGRYKIVWTEDRLYYLVEITDNYISTTRADRPLFEVYNDDCLELFINEDNLGGDHERSHNAFAYHLSFGGENVVDLNTKGEAALFNDHINYIVKRTENTDLYTWEVEMKIFDKTFDEDNPGNNTPVKLSEGKVMGFAAAYCDADETNSRERFIGSVDIPGENKNVAWQNADVFAKLYLVK